MAVRAALHLIISLFDLARRVEPQVIESAAVGFIEIDEPACIALGKNVLKRLSSKKVPDSPALQTATVNLRAAIAKEEDRYSRSPFIGMLQNRQKLIG
jgi:hypothetical protein